MSAITVDGDLVHYEVLGRGRAVVLVHGWIGSWRYWIPTMQKLHLKYRVYAVDLFGFGDSAKNRRRYTIDQQVHLIVELMAQLGLKKTAMIGHGLGALVLTEFAQRHHDKIARLMISNAPLLNPGDLDTRVPPGQQILLTARPFDISQAIHNVQSRPASPADKTIARRPDAGAPGNDATIVNDRLINRSRLREAALARAAGEMDSLTPPPRNTNPTDNSLFRLIGGMDSEAILQKCFKRSETNYEKLQADVTKMDDAAVPMSAHNYDPGRMLDILRALKIPIVAVHGTDDPLISEPTDDIWNYLTADKEDLLLPVPLPGVRHFPMLESDDFFQVVSGFLEQQDINNISIKTRWRRRSR